MCNDSGGVDGQRDDEEGGGRGNRFAVRTFPDVEAAAGGTGNYFGGGTEYGFGTSDFPALEGVDEAADAVGATNAAPIGEGFAGNKPESEAEEKDEEEKDFKNQRRTLLLRCGPRRVRFRKFTYLPIRMP